MRWFMMCLATSERMTKMAAADKLKQTDATLVTFRYSRHFNADAKVVWRAGMPFVSLCQFCEGMAKNLNWVSPNFDVKARFKSSMGIAMRELSAENPAYKAGCIRVRYANFYTPELISKAINHIMHLFHPNDIPTMKELARWMSSKALADQLEEATDYKTAIVVGDFRLKRRALNPGDWAYSKGASFRIPSKQSLWEVDTTARFRAANAKPAGDETAADTTA